ncbi:hypothetical protein AVEN_34413-1 [Araneus ventricosus]|uniref:Transcriptional coactivator p15 (PC4) C-terminal domain-containing protein n=1 Tax=Araneus ventricosus TaxID=182803 RepID=A0A4Y2G2P6_ARAVE|nr:hypothetical protein AVEN_34413-1 [Araneus ventricosus]
MSFAQVSGNSKRKSEKHGQAAKKLCSNERTEHEISLSSLPKSMVHLGDGLFVAVNTFQKETRVHIRLYSTDDNGFLHPTKEGVSLKPEVWSSVLLSLRTFPALTEPDAVTVAKKDVCIFNETGNTQMCVSLQILFQRKDNSFHLVPERIILRGVQIERLWDSYNRIFTCVKSSLLAYTLKERVNFEIRKYPVDENLDGWDADTPQGFEELRDSLCKCLLDFISRKISVLSKSECIDCKQGFLFNTDAHDCVSFSKKQNFDAYFEKAHYYVEWDVLAAKFVKLNIHRPFLRWFQDDLFTEMDTVKFFSKIEEMYLNETPDVSLSCFDL